jgi:succinate dehydrogenase / fumarate reductase membrane anchor subunit
MSAPAIERPRSRSGRSNFELNTWLFMRGSGVLLAVLVFGHLFVNLMTGKGINQIDFAFVAGKWSNPFWQVWDLAMLWLLYFSAFVVLVLGTLVIFTFDPCIDPESTLEVCRNA